MGRDGILRGWRGYTGPALRESWRGDTGRIRWLGLEMFFIPPGRDRGALGGL